MRLIIPFAMDLSAAGTCTANGVDIAEPDLTAVIGDPLAYNAGTTYAKADRVHSITTKRIYQSRKAGNVGQALPVAPEYKTEWWEDVGAINRHACTDDVLSNRTRGASPLRITVDAPNADTVAALNVQGVQVLFELVVGASVVWSSTQSTNDLTHITDGYQYDFAEVRTRTDVLVAELPPYYNAKLRVTITGANVGDTVGIGRLVVGRSIDLGKDLLGMQPGLLNWSSADLSADTGITHLNKQGGRSRRLQLTSVVPRGQLDAVLQAGEDTHNRYCLWSVDPAVKSLNVFARHARFETVVDNEHEVTLNLQLEGAV